MKKIYAAFKRVGNAKAAVGRVKKESWNRADLVIIFPGEPTVKTDNNRFEFGNEYFLDSPHSGKASEWPSLQDKEIDGIGKVKIAVSYKPDNNPDLSEDSAGMNKELIASDLKKNKVVAIIEADDELVSKIETILDSEGAEITIFGEKREEL